MGTWKQIAENDGMFWRINGLYSIVKCDHQTVDVFNKILDGSFRKFYEIIH